MSADDPSQREVAHRLFAAEYDDADYSYSESDEERAPNYVVTPTGARVNRLFVVGVLTEVTRVNDDMLRGRVADPTGAFVVYAGQYQPDEQAVLEQTEPPAFVAVTGKANTFQPEDGDTVYTSIRPESINAVDAETRDRWTVQTAEQTLSRVHHAATALSTGVTGDRLRERLTDQAVDPDRADGITRALTHYGTTPAYLAGLRDLALDAARVVAGRRDEVQELSVTPDEPGDGAAEEVVATTPGEVGPAGAGVSDTETGVTGNGEGGGTTETVGGTEPGPDEGATAEPDTDTDTGSTVTDTRVESETGAAAETPEPADDSETTTTAGGTADGRTDTPEQTTVGDPGEFDADEFDLPEAVREEVESEFGTEFQSGTEVDDPGEADIQTAEPAGEPEGESEPETVSGPGLDTGRFEGGDDQPGGATEGDDTAQQSGDTATEAGDGDGVEDPQAAVLGLMTELDDGAGADRAAVVREAGERHGLDEAAVEEAIQGALMDGKCYEPDEQSLKPI